MAVSVGNPHCVLFVKDAERAPVAALGAAIERHPWFPARTNVEFIEVLKLDVAFLYDLLGASQEHKIKPKKFAQTDIDEVIIGHTNEPEFRKLQNNEFMEALRDRTIKVDIHDDNVNGFDADALALLKVFAVEKGPDIYLAAHEWLGEYAAGGSGRIASAGASEDTRRTALAAPTASLWLVLAVTTAWAAPPLQNNPPGALDNLSQVIGALGLFASYILHITAAGFKFLLPCFSHGLTPLSRVISTALWPATYLRLSGRRRAAQKIPRCRRWQHLC